MVSGEEQTIEFFKGTLKQLNVAPGQSNFYEFKLGASHTTELHFDLFFRTSHQRWISLECFSTLILRVKFDLINSHEQF